MLNIIISDTLIGHRRFGCVSFDTHSEIQSVKHVWRHICIMMITMA